MNNFKIGDEFITKGKYLNLTAGKSYIIWNVDKEALYFSNDINRMDAIHYTHVVKVDNTTKNNDGETYGGRTRDITPPYYGEKCKCGRKIDWYVIGDLYRKDKGEAWSHAGKKLLRAGEGHKTLIQDIDEVIDSLNRWKEQLNDIKESK